MIMANPVSGRSLPNYLIPHTHPGIFMPPNLLEIAQRNTDPNLAPKKSIETHIRFMRKHCVVVDEHPEIVGCESSSGQQLAQSTLNRFMSDPNFQIEKIPNSYLRGILLLLSSQITLSQNQSFRTVNVSIYRAPGIGELFENREKFVAYLQKNDPENLDCFLRCAKNEFPQFLQEVQNNPFEDPISESRVLSPESKKFLKSYFDQTIDPRFIESKMDQFFTELKKKIIAQESPIEIAAFAHMRIVKLHPFTNGNGRTARLFMNLLLQQFGHPPIYFYSEKEYAREVQMGLKDIGSFARFISRKIFSFQQLKKVAQEVFTNPVEQDNYMAEAGLTTCERVITPILPT